MVIRECRWLPVVFMVIMVISGYQWFSMVTRSCIWSPESVDGYGGFYGYHGYHGYQWFSMVTRS